MKIRLLLFILFIILFTIGSGSQYAKAATVNWTGGTSSAWGTGSNWSTGGVPSNSDDIRIGVIAFTNQPILSSATTCASLTIGNTQTVVLSVNAALTVTNGITITGGTINSNASGTITATNVSLTAAVMTLNAKLTVNSVLQTPGPTGNSTLTTNGSSNVITGGIAVHTGSNLTWNGSGTTTCGNSTVYSTTTLTIGSGNNINFTGGLGINSGATPGFLVNTGNLTFTSSSLSTGGPSSLTTAITNNTGGVITLTGSGASISLGSNAGLSNSGMITANSGTSLATNSGSKYTNNNGGIINLTTAAFTITGNASLANSGDINLNTTSALSTGNPCTITNTSTGNINATASTITFNGGTTINNSGDIAFASSSTLTTGNPVTLTNTAGSTLSLSASTATFNGGLTLNNSGTISGALTSTITCGNPVPITNTSTGAINLSATQLTLNGGANITNSGAVSLVSGSKITFGNPSYINNNTAASTLTVTGSTLAIAAGGYITNSGTVTTSGTSTINLSGNPSYITNNVNAVFNVAATTLTMVAGANITNTGGTFNAASSSFSVTGNPAYISNQNSGAVTGIFNFNACAVTFNGSNSIQNAGTVTMNNGSSLTMSGTSNTSYINNTGTFYAGTSNSACTITMSGPSSQISNSGTFYLGSTSAIGLAGNTSYVSNLNFFIIQSDAYGSGTLSAIGSTATGYTGTYYAERYLAGGSAVYRGYRLMSSPVYAATVGVNKVYSINYLQSNTLLTGDAGGGFDKTGNPTLYLNREDKAVSNVTFTSGNFWGITRINNSPAYNYYLNSGSTTFNIPIGTGFLLFDRGNRTSNLANKYTPGTTAESITMTAIGTLNQGQVIVHNWYTPSSANLGYTTTAGNAAIRGYNMVGNPYASSIDWETFQTSTTTTGIYGTSVGNSMYILNPVNQNYGVYAKGGGGVGTNNATNIIASGQGFFVNATCSCAQLIFNETAKTTAQNTGLNLFMGMPADQTANVQYLRLQLAKDTVNTDDMLVRFNYHASSAYVAGVDAPYKQGFGKVSLSSSSSDHIPLVINVQPLPDKSETIGLNVNTTADGNYTLNVKNLVGIPQLFDIWLMDAYKKDSLDMRHNTSYSFDVLKSDTNTSGSKRFSLVIRQNPAYAYHLLDFAATKITSTNDKQVQIVWKSENEQNYTHFTVERSTDGGKTFEVVGGTQSNTQGTYSLIDKQPVSGQNLYRLKQEDINDHISYSAIIPVAYADLSNSMAKSTISVYPNPAKNTINLAITSDVTKTASYSIQITNSLGLIIKQGTSAQPEWQASVNDLLPGTYIVKVLNNKDNSLIGNTKFVKQ